MTPPLVSTPWLTFQGGLNEDFGITEVGDQDLLVAQNVLIGPAGDIIRRPAWKVHSSGGPYSTIQGLVGGFGDPEYDEAFCGINFSATSSSLARDLAGTLNLYAPTGTGLSRMGWAMIYQAATNGNLQATTLYIICSFTMAGTTAAEGIPADGSGPFASFSLTVSGLLAAFRGMLAVVTAAGTYQISDPNDAGTWEAQGVGTVSLNVIDAREWNERLYIFGWNGVAVVSATSPADMVVQYVSRTRGGRVLGPMKGALAVVTRDGPKLFDGVNFHDLSLKVKKSMIGDPDPAVLTWNVTGQESTWKTYVAISLGSSGGAANPSNVQYVWDQRTKAYVKWVDNYGTGAHRVMFSDHFHDSLSLWVADTTAMKLYRMLLDDTVYTDASASGGSAYQYLMDARTKFFDLGSPATDKNWMWVDVLASGTGTLYVYFQTDWQNGSTPTAAAYQEQPTNGTVGDATASVALSSTPTVYRFYLPECRAKSVSIVLRDQPLTGTPPASGSIRVHSLQLHAVAKRAVTRN